jgi:hypothetical protein
VGNGKINVVPRRNEDRRLLHLVNMVPGTAHEDVTVTLSRQFAGAVDAPTLHSPGRQPASLRCRTEGGLTKISVPYLKEWGIVTLFSDQRQATSAGPSSE